MTDINYTHITLVVDRSGSMGSILGDAQGGLNTFLDQQATLGVNNPLVRCTLTLVEFDDKYTVVHEFADIKGAAPSYKLVPRGSTALLDAMGKAATVTGEKLASLPEDKRPGQVFFVVMTDGGENSSREWTKQQVTNLLKTNQDVYGWQVMYLSADLNAAHDAAAYGVSASTTLLSTMGSYGAAVITNSNAILRSRTDTYAGGQSVAVAYTEDEQAAVA